MIINSINKLLILTSALMVIFITNLFINRSNNDFLVFLNIGQGNSTLVCTKEQICGLIDTGKQDNIISEIKKYTSKPLSFIVLTHPDLDHVGETNQIVNQIGVKNIFFSQTTKAATLLEQIEQNSTTKIYELRDNNDFSFGEYNFDILWPNTSIDLNTLESNDTSTSLLISNKNHKVFIAGDLPSKIELLLQKSYNLNNIEISQLSHHGSKNSSSEEFMAKMRPALSIISVGKNSYGHPSKEVLKILENLRLNFLRTDKDGDIKISIFEQKLDISTQISKKSYIILN